jgi:hypothetical protein
MRQWKSRYGIPAFSLLVGICLALPVAADEAPAVSATHHGVAVIAVVRARDLMSPTDRQAYRRAMRAAPTEQARRDIREATLVTLRQRAAEHGMVMVIEARVLRPGEGRREPNRLEVPDHPAPLPPRAP